MTTGLELYRILQANIDKPFTGYITPPQGTRWFKSAYIKCVNDLYSDRLNNQRAYDEIGYLISLNTIFDVNQTTNTIPYSSIPIASVVIFGTTVTVATEIPHGYSNGDTVTLTDVLGVVNVNNLPHTIVVTSPTNFQFTEPTAAGVATPNTGSSSTTKSVSDYLHYLYGEATFVEPYYGISVLEATNTTPIRIRLNKRNKIRSVDKLIISGITGNTNANGEYYVKELNEFWLALYSDATLQTPVAGNGTSGGTGTIKIVTESKGMKLWFNDQKGASLGQPSVLESYFQQGKLQFTIYPINIPCRKVKIDYIRKMPVAIDATNNTYDFERSYPYYFLEKIAIEAGRQFSVASRDGSLHAGLTQEVTENP